MVKRSCTKFLVAGIVLFMLVSTYSALTTNANAAEEASAAVVAEQVEPHKLGPPAPKLKLEDYPIMSLFRSRDAIWLVAQLHLYFGAFVVSVPLFVLCLEGIGMRTEDKVMKEKYDRMGHDFMRISITAFAITAILGGLLFFLLFTLYPDFMKHLNNIFGGQMLIYASLFFLESFFLYIYYYGWDAMQGPLTKWLHISSGLMLNACGLTLMVLANAWATFMMAPSGVTVKGEYLGNIWAAIRGPLWNPVNLHRIIANLALGGAICAAYAGYRYLQCNTKEEKEYYDWMGYTGILISATGLLPLPFAGYWLMREVYAFSQQMGISLMGGLFAWVFIIQALLIGAIFLSFNYYLWLGMGRIRGVKGYQHYVKYMVIVLIGAFLVWFTPHSIVLSGRELKSLGGAHHHYLGFFGVMSAKNTAVNMMILVSGLCFLLYCRGNKVPTVKWARQGDTAQVALYFMGTVNIIGLGIYGYFLPANIRIGLSVPQVCTTFSCICFSFVIDYFLYKKAEYKGKIVWGEMPAISQYVLVGMAMSFAWLMGLMGFIRSSVRQYWHLYAVMRDNSADAYSQTVGYMANFVSMATVIFTLTCVFIFWLASLSQKGHEVEEVKEVPEGAVAAKVTA